MNAVVRVERVKLGEHFSSGVLNYLALKKWVVLPNMVWFEKS